MGVSPMAVLVPGGLAVLPAVPVSA